MTGLSPAELLRRAADVLDIAGGPELAPVTSGLRNYLRDAPKGARLDRELGLVSGPGSSPWWQADGRARRDDAIRRLAEFYPGSATARAAEASRDIRHYAGTCWVRDRARGGPYPDSPRRRALFDIFDADSDPPSGSRRLYDIIAAGIG